MAPHGGMCYMSCDKHTTFHMSCNMTRYHMTSWIYVYLLWVWPKKYSKLIILCKLHSPQDTPRDFPSVFFPLGMSLGGRNHLLYQCSTLQFNWRLKYTWSQFLHEPIIVFCPHKMYIRSLEIDQDYAEKVAQIFWKWKWKVRIYFKFKFNYTTIIILESMGTLCPYSF